MTVAMAGVGSNRRHTREAREGHTVAMKAATKQKKVDQAELEVLAEPKRHGGNGGDGADQANSPPAQQVYSHPTKKRCPRCSGIMRSLGTRESGRLKRWVCTAPICRATVQTVGQVV